MIRYTQGNLLHADTEAVVNTVNTVGVMGKGVALAFEDTYPGNFTEYEAACRAQRLKTGRMFVYISAMQASRRFQKVPEGLADPLMTV